MKKSAETSNEKQGLALKVEQFKAFFEHSQQELKKVVWPSREETISTSSAVLLLVVVLALFLGLVDFGLSKLISTVLS